jgi:prepilin-type N-terminal cleavage/methylation domain-containing protein
MRNIYNNHGFNLIEVIIAMAVLSFVLLGMARLINITVSVNRNSGEKTAAITLAQDKMEEIMAKGYSGIASIRQTVSEDYDSLPSVPTFKRITDIHVDKPHSGMKLITVDVYWDNDKRRVRFQSILSRIGSD